MRVGDRGGRKGDRGRWGRDLKLKGRARAECLKHKQDGRRDQLLHALLGRCENHSFALEESTGSHDSERGTGGREAGGQVGKGSRVQHLGWWEGARAASHLSGWARNYATKGEREGLVNGVVGQERALDASTIL